MPKNLVEGGVTREAVKNFADHVQLKLAVAKKQNDQVYHERVPDADTLESFSGLCIMEPPYIVRVGTLRHHILTT